MSAEQRLARAEQAYEAGSHAAAIADAKAVLEREPQNVAARVLLAKLSFKLGDLDAASKDLARAIEAGADPASLRILHYDIELGRGRFQAALDEALGDPILKPLDRALVLTRAHLGLGQPGEAEQALGEALKIDPNGHAAALLRARVQAARGLQAEARKTLEALIARDAQDAEAWLLDAHIAFASGAMQAAATAYERATQTGKRTLSVPELVLAYAGLVESRLASGEIDSAPQALEPLRKLAPGAPITRWVTARLALARGDARAAVTELQQAARQQPDHLPTRVLLGAALIEQGNLELAESELQRVVAAAPENAEARKLLARLYLTRNDPGAARSVLSGLPAAERPDAGAEWLTGTALLLSGQNVEGIAALERAVEADPASTPPKLDLVAAYLSAGRRDDALALLGRLPASEGGLRRRQLQVLAEVTGRSAAEARAGVDRLLRAHPDDAELLTIGGGFLLSAGDADAAARAFAAALSVSPRQANARLGVAAVAIARGDWSAAERELRSALEADDKAERAYVGLAGLALRRGDRSAAREWLEKAIAADPAVVEPRLLLAELALLDADLPRMESLLEQAQSVSRSRASALNRAGALLLRASKLDAALARFNEAAALGLADADLGAARALLALGREAEARQRLEALAVRRRGAVPPVALLVGLDVRAKRFPQALARIDALERAGAPIAAVEELRGDVQATAGNPVAALAAYERASAVTTTAALAIKQYRAQRAAGRPAPERILERWLQTRPEDVLVRAVLAEHHQRVGNRRAAIAEYERALERQESAILMNNLSWLYYETGDVRALDLAARAHQLAGAVPDIADTYGWILAERGQFDKALPILERAARAAPSSAGIQYHYGVALARAGQGERARPVLERLAASASDRTVARDAQRELERLGGALRSREVAR